MDTERYIVAVEIGSSKITGAIGTRSLKGVVTVLGVDTEPLTGSVKRGFVVNPDEVSSKVKRLIRKLNNRIGASKKIKQVYVGIGGQSLHAEDHMISRDYPEGTPITEDIIKRLQEEARESIHNNGGGVYNHQLYFDSMRSPVGQEPCGTLEEALIRDFGSVRQWKEQMSQAAIGVFGSGGAWLVSDQDGTLMILTTANQDVPDLRLYTPILLIDVWEHAYYLQYRNRRPDYVQGWHKLIHWKKAERRYEQVLCRLERGNENGEQTDHKKRTGRDRL